MAARILTFLAVVATGMLALHAFADHDSAQPAREPGWRAKIAWIAR